MRARANGHPRPPRCAERAPLRGREQRTCHASRLGKHACRCIALGSRDPLRGAFRAPATDASPSARRDAHAPSTSRLFDGGEAVRGRNSIEPMSGRAVRGWDFIESMSGRPCAGRISSSR
ncbi:hypothetical protein DB32_006086 [Sandaracinus amylolyticus]|uniref:Uncharacterized protein n=1 Tax=Sandaracinus amylolyticus TaxID=927083 RepID=A0A0F6W6R8_9BACT|nr:hypothetical protein DB32_006086 [Sandaracinus amylolyticus]